MFLISGAQAHIFLDHSLVVLLEFHIVWVFQKWHIVLNIESKYETAFFDITPVFWLKLAKLHWFSTVFDILDHKMSPILKCFSYYQRSFCVSKLTKVYSVYQWDCRIFSMPSCVAWILVRIFSIHWSCRSAMTLVQGPSVGIHSFREQVELVERSFQFPNGLRLWTLEMKNLRIPP